MNPKFLKQNIRSYMHIANMGEKLFFEIGMNIGESNPYSDDIRQICISVRTNTVQ